MSRWPMVMASLPRSACRSRASCHVVRGGGMRGPCGIRGAVDQCALHARARCAECASRWRRCGREAAFGEATQCDGWRGMPSAGPKPLSRRMSRRKAVRTSASNGWRGRQASRPSTVRQARNGTRQRVAQPCEPRRGDQIEQRAAHDRIGASDARRPIAARASRCDACIRHRPCGVDTSSSSPAPSRRTPVAAPTPRAAERLIQQRGIGIDQDPVLPAADDRRQEAEHAAGAGPEIQQARPPAAADRASAAPTPRCARRDRTVRAARASPRRTAPSLRQRLGEFPRLRLPARQRLTHLPRRLRHLATQSAPKIIRRSAFDRLM